MLGSGGIFKPSRPPLQALEACLTTPDDNTGTCERAMLGGCHTTCCSGVHCYNIERPIKIRLVGISAEKPFWEYYY